MSLPPDQSLIVLALNVKVGGSLSVVAPLTQSPFITPYTLKMNTSASQGQRLGQFPLEDD